MGNSGYEDSSDPFIFFRDGGRKIVNFAITNDCNASCIYCSFPKETCKKYVGLPEAKQAIDYLSAIKTGVLALTGGEPLLHPDLPAIVEYARKKGLIVYTGTNGILLSDELAGELKHAAINAVWISFESSSYQTFNKNRGVNNLHKMVREGVRALKNAGVTVFAIALINKSITDFELLVDCLVELGFDKVKFDYPMGFELASSYKGWSMSPLLRYTGPEMEHAITAILEIKDHGPIQVINPTAGLLGAIDLYHHHPPKYPCYAGEKVLYLDWNLDIYRCPALSERMGHVGDRIEFKKLDCNQCYYQGVRDYDPFYYLLEKVDDIFRGVGRFSPDHFVFALKKHELAKLYETFITAWQIKASGLI